jgi:hypothetical protein
MTVLGRFMPLEPNDAFRPDSDVQARSRECLVVDLKADIAPMGAAHGGLARWRNS